MMPRKQVYGRRAKDAFSVTTSTTGFAWSSPSKSSPPASDALDRVTTALGNLKVATKDKTEMDEHTKERKPLRTRDGNAVKKRGKRVDATMGKSVENHGSQDVCHSLKSLTLNAKRDGSSENEESTQGQTNAAQSERLHNTSGGQTPNLSLRMVPPDGDVTASLTKTQRKDIRSSTPIQSPTPAANPLTKYAQPLLRLCHDKAARNAPIPFSAWSSDLEPHFDVRKIAEASYGEVYRLSIKDLGEDWSRSDESVLKIIALKPPMPDTAPEPNSREAKKAQYAEEKAAWMSSMDSVVSEVQLLQRMAPIPGFTNFRDVRVLQGRPSACFVKAWKEFNKTRPKGDKSIFPDPSRKANYDDEQLWAVIEMQDAGTDLENVDLKDIWSVWDVFWGVALTVAKGEESVRFEHRDLHLGNICIRSTRPDQEIVRPKVRHTNRKLGYTGLETTIIDYTLSRADMDNPGDVAYLDLERDPALWEGDGDVEYQYDIYRYMRGFMYFCDPFADVAARWDEAVASGLNWRDFHSRTNLVWLHFVLHQLLEQMVWPSTDYAFTLDQLDKTEDRKLAKKRAAKLERALGKLQQMLDPEALPDSEVKSGTDLVAYALYEDWLDEMDVLEGPEKTVIEDV